MSSEAEIRTELVRAMMTAPNCIFEETVNDKLKHGWRVYDEQHLVDAMLAYLERRTNET